VLEKITELVADAVQKGGRLLSGGDRPLGFERGYYFMPTVFSEVPASAKLLHEELFGPIAPIMGFTDFDGAIHKANDTRFGLAGYLFTSKLKTAVSAAEKLKCGIVGVNDLTPATPQCPFGGVKDSGYGREGGYQGLDESLYTKYISVTL
jgi:succinate-semialdehyde dehydrogenase / glutarate-semialdehyde dehydrogenase